MSITGSLANALSGLAAQSKAAELVSSNVANAGTPGYGRREISLTPRYSGVGSSTGVNVTGVRREVDEIVVGNRRLADASAGYASTIADFKSDFETMLGPPTEAGSLSGRVSRLEAALVEAAARPDRDARLSSVVDAARSLAGFLNETSDSIQTARLEADKEIARQVDQLNAGLNKVQSLNYKIRQTIARGEDASSLVDLRQQTIDGISTIVPMRSVQREFGMVALFTTGGAVLLDGRAAELSFTPVNTIVPDMTLESGALSGLTINGNEVNTQNDRGPIAGGSLAALFEVRDVHATRAQSQMDGFARDLVERFQDPALDLTRAAGDPGLFTDAGATFDPVNELGLSARIEVNALVDPAQGGEVWRLRDGLGAPTPGNPGAAGLLNDLVSTLSQGRPSSVPGLSALSRSANELAGDLLSLASTDAQDAGARKGFASAEQSSLKNMELEGGVDTDQEMQKLMLIEQAFAANAKVITTIDDLINVLIGM
ncbi:MAG: flagellar hook-associated protein FlgK [Alphaproteobacteria bacterium]|nr:MAG: flagellar hook-associated protein FlgK [Alphaproteobacteria bacterium]